MNCGKFQFGKRSTARRRRRPAYAAIRSLILAISTLAIVGVLFAVYQFATGVGHARKATPKLAAPVTLTKNDPEEPAVSVSGAPIGRGARTSIRLYNPGSNKPRMELEVSDYRPTGAKGANGEDEIRLDAPEIRLTAPDGQRIKVSADEGSFWMAKRSTGALEPKNGRLAGNVAIRIDRISTAQRDALPPEQRDNPAEDRLIRMDFDEVHFDLEQSSFQTDGPFHFKMAEAELDAKGLYVRYNAVDARIERFEIAGGGKAVIDAPSSMFDVALPGAATDADATQSKTADAPLTSGDDNARTPAEQAKDVEATQPLESASDERDADATQELGSLADVVSGSSVEEAPSSESEFPVISLDDGAHKSAQPVQTYEGLIDGDVTVEQSRPNEDPARLLSDTITFLFDFGPEARDAARLGNTQFVDPTPEPAVTTPQSNLSNLSNQSNQSAADDSEHKESNEKALIQWTGKFLVQPVKDEKPRAQDDPRRLWMTAKGRHVSFSDGRREFNGTHLEFHRESGMARLEGAPFVLRSEHCAELVGVEADINERDGVATIVGPARLSGYRTDSNGASPNGASPDGAEFEIRFVELAELDIAQFTQPQHDSGAAQPRDNQGQYISGARFTGDVNLRFGDDHISGDLLFATFDPPSQPGAFGAQIRTLDAQGRVIMFQGDDHLTCSRLAVAFANVSGGRPIPRRAEAVGDVFLSQGTRTISATDQINVQMVPVLKQKPPFDPVLARREAIRRGVDPTTVDWDQQRRKYENEVEYTAGLESVDARGAVTAYDPTDGLDISAESLRCAFANGRDLKSARVAGPDGKFAHVAMSSFAVSANLIDVDMTEERAEVFGPGQVEFETLRGLDGAREDSPQHVRVTWSREMTFRGKENTGRFLGDVRAVTSRQTVSDTSWIARWGFRESTTYRESSALEAEELVIDFAESEAQPVPPDSPPIDLWIFSTLIQPAEKPRSPFATSGINREPVYVVASRNVVATFANADPVTSAVKNRVRLIAQKMTVDLRSELLNVPVDGKLLIEDYRNTPDPTASEKGQPLFNDKDGMPSQSFIEWADSFTFQAKTRRADFTGAVILDHRRGSRMALAHELVPGSKNLSDAAKNAGRQTRLSCGRLSVEFGADDTQQASTGVGALSVKEIRQFQAIHNVFLEDDEFTVIAQRMDKHDRSKLLRIFGAEGQPAEIYGTDRGGIQFKGEEFNYNLETGQVDAPKAQLQGRR